MEKLPLAFYDISAVSYSWNSDPQDYITVVYVCLDVCVCIKGSLGGVGMLDVSGS